jgi:glycosyltransferase involved in cell wall biosynthesis
VNELAILIPVLRRAHRVLPLIEDINASGVDADIVFIASSNDKDECDELERAQQLYDNVRILKMPPTKVGDYALKINWGYTAAPDSNVWFFLAADDIHFEPGWFQSAESAYVSTGRRVIGTQDLGNSRVLAGEHSTHTLVHRSYVEEYGTIDEADKILHEGYPHEFVDDEFIETAKLRDEFVFSYRSVVEHLHPMWGKAPSDPLYDAHRVRMRNGRRLFTKRQRLWTSR